ncbi:hypothetical protein [Kitasatospora sp. MAP5-34]|uniref:hypothetical protein n=1 Tax=Kitasatospora sp. MAP5-34 TaxID=3035102 RepID=UPI002474C800|nr:hypothetical protein [Kitasatospora sp. MAP5-34]MDH6576923.1 hypothetical protein [Kitasatospora sp. MAP5-34]
MTSPNGPRQASNDAAMFAISLLKARVGAGSAEAALVPFTELLDGFEQRFGAEGLRLLVAHLAEMTASFVGIGRGADIRLEAYEMELMRKQQSGGSPGA